MTVFPIPVPKCPFLYCCFIWFYDWGYWILWLFSFRFEVKKPHFGLKLFLFEAISADYVGHAVWNKSNRRKSTISADDVGWCKQKTTSLRTHFASWIENSIKVVNINSFQWIEGPNNTFKVILEWGNRSLWVDKIVTLALCHLLDSMTDWILWLLGLVRRGGHRIRLSLYV